MPEPLSTSSEPGAVESPRRQGDPFDVAGWQDADLILERQICGRRMYFTEDGAAAFDAMLREGFEFWPEHREGWLQMLVSSERRRLPDATSPEER